MRTWRTLLGNERGAALVLSLMMLLTLTGLLLAFISVSALEPQISRNVTDTARARYLAEAGIETGFNLLINTPSFSTALSGATASAPWVPLVNNATLAGVTTGGTSAEAAFAGTYSVLVRNDYQNADSAVTGQAAGTSVTPNETMTSDSNNIVIMRATGSFNGATRMIEVVVRRAPLPPFPGAVNLPGLQADSFINKTAFDVDGRDFSCTSSCDNPGSWTAGSGMKYGIATQTGTQSNVGVSYEARVESAVSGSSSKQASIKGKHETNGTYTSGLNTIQADASLNPTVMQQYIDAVASYPGTTILQSTQACPMQLTGSATPTSTPTVTNGCTGPDGVNQTLDLGTRDNPKMVYFRGDTDPTSLFTGLTLNSGIKGAGILIVEDGDLKNLGNFQWDGVVIVTGNYVGSGFMDNSDTLIRGAFVANEKMAGEASGFFEFYLHSGADSFTIYNSEQNIEMVRLMRGNTTMTNWREL
ncbi:MAG TPA: PilX N-terminal domain-containing pilus assembly protein [Methylomirabilota bacterium]